MGVDNQGEVNLNRSLSNRKQVVAPYSKLAHIYDYVMSHVDYKTWAIYILKISDQFQPDAKSILDISCGTGSMLISINSKKYSYIGFDLSLEMVKIAKRKKASDLRKMLFFQGDMTAFSLKKRVDIIVCLYDSINYLLNFQLWSSMFDCVYDTLNNGGIFVFDICTEKNSVKYFTDYIESHGTDNYEYIRESSYDRKNKIHKNKFTIDFNNAPTYIEHHQQRIYPIDDVTKFISATGFQMIGSFDGFSFRAASEESLRVHFVLKK